MAFQQVGLEAVLKGVGAYSANANRVVASNSAITKSLNVAAASANKFRKVASLAMKAGAIAVVVGLGLAIAGFVNFDKAMTESLAIMGDVSDAMREDMEVAARDVAKVTTFSMSQAAESYFFLASAGLDAAQSIAALPKVATFAQAGMFDMALATDLLTDAQSALGLTVDDTVQNVENMVRVSDVLVKANTLANATVQQFSTALTREAGAALKTFNKDVEEGVAVLAAFADQGIKGEVAGSSLSRIMRLMGSAAVNNSEAYEQLNIEVFDGQGNMRNLADIIEDLEGALLGMSDAERIASLETLGFQARVQGVILPLLGTSDSIREYEAGLRDAAGITEEVANKQLKSLAAQFSLLRSGIEDLLFTIGKALEPALRAFVGVIREDVIPWVEVRLPKAITLVRNLFEDWKPVLKETADLLRTVGSTIRTAFTWILDNEAALVAALFAISIAMTEIWGPTGLIELGIPAAIILLSLFRAEIDELGVSALRMKLVFLNTFLAIAVGFRDIITLLDLGTGLINKALEGITGKDVNTAITNITSSIREAELQVAKLNATTARATLEARALAVGFTEEEIAAGLAARSVFGLAGATLESRVAAIEQGKVAPTAAQFYRTIIRGAEAAGVSVNQFTLDMITSVSAMIKLAEAFEATARGPQGFRGALADFRDFAAEVQRLKDAIAREIGFDLGPEIVLPVIGTGGIGGAIGDIADDGLTAWEEAIATWLDAIALGVKEGTVTVEDALDELEAGMINRASAIVDALVAEQLRIATEFQIMADIIENGAATLEDAARLFDIGAIEAGEQVLRTLAGEETELSAMIKQARIAAIRPIFPTAANFHEGGFIPEGRTVSATLHGPEIIVPLGANTQALNALRAAVSGFAFPTGGEGFRNFGSITLLAGSDRDTVAMRNITRALGV